VRGSDAPRARVWSALAILLCACFVASIARLYHPVYGFTGLIAFPADNPGEFPALAALPHHTVPAQFTYDGQFYAQLALDPLLRNPSIDRALDQPPYRARRILFSWTAWFAGLGQPWWILQAYALQNVACWLILAALLTRWIPPRSARLFALWSACMFSHGLLASVQFALLDGPSLLLLAITAAAAESGAQWRIASLVGLAALGRETNLLGASMLRIPRSVGDAARLAGWCVVAVLPLLVWQDYLWSIYRSTSGAGSELVTIPLTAYVENWIVSVSGVWRDGVNSHPMWALLVVLSLTVQTGYLLWTRRWREPWWRLALAFAGLMLIAHPVVWHGYPGAITRVVLPLTVGFNVLLGREERAFWPWFVLGNLQLIASWQLMF
jgi:hypothetical protein